MIFFPALRSGEKRPLGRIVIFEKSYSSFSSELSLSVFCFLIKSFFIFSHLSRANNTDFISTFCVRYNQKLSFIG